MKNNWINPELTVLDVSATMGGGTTITTNDGAIYQDKSTGFVWAGQTPVGS